MNGRRRFHLPENRLRHLYLDRGLTPEEIAGQYGCSAGTVRYHLKRYGIPLRSPADVAQARAIHIPKATLEELYVRQGLSGRDVARRLGCDKSVVYRELARHGIPQHSRETMSRILRAKVALRDGIAEETLRRLYEEEQLSVNQVAERLGVSPNTVIRRMDELGIKRRSRSEAGRIAKADIRVDIPEDELRSLYQDQGLSIEVIAERFNVSPSLIKRRMEEYDIPVRSHPEATTTYPKTDFSGDLVEKAYLIGFRQGDLWVGRQNPQGATISITCCSTKRAQVDLIESLFRDYGRVWIGKPDKDGMISITALVNDSFDFLLPKKDKIEDWILADDECFWAFFAGYVDAEGNIGVYNGQARLRLESADKGILFQFWQKLNSLGVCVPKPRLVPKKGKPLLSTPRKGVARQDLWQLETKRKASLLTIFEHIEPYLKHADKRLRLKAAIENILWRNKQFDNLNR